MKSIPSSDYDPRARPKPFTFYPPRTSPFWVGLAKRRIRRTIRRQLKVTEIDISAAGLETLQRLKGQRCLITPSHSGGYEPHIILYLSKLLDEIFNYVAAVEVFEQSPINRWLMPRLGVYSIVRGAVDRQSFATTRELLAAGKRWLVIFPEGHSIGQNSTLAPFQEGVIELAFKAFEDARASDAAAHLYCVPIAIKYIYLTDMHDEIDRSLDRMAKALSIPKTATAVSRYARLRQIAEAVLVANERAHQVQPDASSAMNDRIQNLKVLVVSQIERQLSIVPNERQTLLHRIRCMFNAVDRIVHDEPPASEYERRLALERGQMTRTLYDDLWRLVQFVAIYDGYVRESMTVERFMDVLGLLEQEVFKKRCLWGPRKAMIRVGQPIDLKDCAAAYDQNRRETCQGINARLESAVRAGLEGMEATGAVVRDDY
jgi:1-acyl-sn-glycerol-3-phosphate acyltransferase